MRVVFVADQFLEDYPYGGAELTTEALIQTSPFPVVRYYSDELTEELVERHLEDCWIFGNFFNVPPRIIPLIVERIRYSVLEYDYKFCLYRAINFHGMLHGSPCNCETTPRGMLILYFLRFASTIWWMSEKQKELYLQRARFLEETRSEVLSSVFSPESLDLISTLRESGRARKGFLVLNSPHWIKNAEGAETWCRLNGVSYEKVWGISHPELLEKLAVSEGLVYLPNDSDTCPRLVIEAKLLGCQLVLNDNVQHAAEPWFNDIFSIEAHLRSAPQRFWRRVEEDIRTHRIQTELLYAAM